MGKTRDAKTCKFVFMCDGLGVGGVIGAKPRHDKKFQDGLPYKGGEE